MATLTWMMPSFAEPVYFWMLLALLPLFLLRLRAHRLSRKGTPGLVAHRLRNELIIGSNPWLRWLSFAFYSLALALLVTALARPQWGHEEVASESEGRNIIIAMDTSRSMLATDLLPDRLTRARLAAQDLVDSLPNDRIGLIAFAGRSFLQAPLTTDHMAIVETLNQLDTEIIPRGGTNINSAVTMAIETFQKADSKDNALIIFSDGEDLEGGEELARIGKDAEDLGMVVIAIGVGTEAGSIIPDPSALTPGVFIKNDVGNIVRSRLDPAALQQLSTRTSRGLYLNLGSSNSIADIVGQALEQIEVSRYEDAMKKRPIERFAWPLSAALLFMILGFVLPLSLRRKPRRRVSIPPAARPDKGPASTGPPPLPSTAKTSALLLVGFSILYLSPVQAETPPAKIPDRPALESFQNKDYKTATKTYQQEIEKADSPSKKSWLQFGLGSAAYRSGDLELAEQSFGKVLENPGNKQLNADAHYNLGNTLFRHGQALLKPDTENPAAGTSGDIEGTTRQWQAAIEHYKTALDVKPGHPLATQNLKTVGNYLKRLKEQEQEQKKDQEKEDQEKNEDEDEEKDEQEDEEGEGEGKDQKQDPKDSKGNQPPSEDQDKGDNKDPQQPPSDPDKPEDQKPGDQKKPSDQEQGQPKDQQDGKGNEDGKKQPPSPEQAEPQEKTPEGNLKARPNQQQQMNAADAREGKEDQQRNPETGFSPLEARRLLQSLSDEDLSVKPMIRPSPAQPYKNW